jgi:predicted dehydrogenase
VDEVVVFGRTPEKLAKIGDQFGFATTTNLDAVIGSTAVDLTLHFPPSKLKREVASS